MTERRPLTARQKEIYDFVVGKIRERGYGPTLREIGVNFQIKSASGVMHHLRAIEKKGYMRREPNLARAIEIIDGPESSALRPKAAVH